MPEDVRLPRWIMPDTDMASLEDPSPCKTISRAEDVMSFRSFEEFWTTEIQPYLREINCVEGEARLLNDWYFLPDKFRGAFNVGVYFARWSPEDVLEILFNGWRAELERDSIYKRNDLNNLKNSLLTMRSVYVNRERTCMISEVIIKTRMICSDMLRQRELVSRVKREAVKVVKTEMTNLWTRL